MRKPKFFSAALALVLIFCFALPVLAAEAPCEAATAQGHYRHPVTGLIEDSGGESSEALGQSMVSSVVVPEALMETGSDGQLYLSLRFNLMSNISDIYFAIQSPGDADWTPVGYESTGTGEDTQDLRFAFPGKDAILRCQLFVVPMGRAVVFYVTVDGFTEGNPGNFARMDADYTPKFTAPNRPDEEPLPQVTMPQGSVTNVGKDGQVLGLVVGGQGTNSQTDAADAAPAGSIIISGRVWAMVFILVFCAQLLACFVFWGLLRLVRGSKRPHNKIPKADAVTYDDDDDFDSDDWMEFDDEEN